MERIEIFIRQIRKTQNISSWRLASISGVSHSQILRIENGYESPTLKTLLRIADALGVDIKDTFIVIRGGPDYD